MALWDLLGKARGEPVWRLLGYRKADPKKRPMRRSCSATRRRRRWRARANARAEGFRAAKFGWGPIGRGTRAGDADHLAAAREGLGADGILLVDAGQIFGDDVERAAARLPALEAARATLVRGAVRRRAPAGLWRAGAAQQAA